MNINNLSQGEREWLKGSSYALFDGESFRCLTEKQRWGFSIIYYSIIIAFYGSIYFLIKNSSDTALRSVNMLLVSVSLIGALAFVVLVWQYFAVRFARRILWSSGKWESVKVLQEKEGAWSAKGMVPFWLRIAFLVCGFGYFLFKVFAI